MKKIKNFVIEIYLLITIFFIVISFIGTPLFDSLKFTCLVTSCFAALTIFLLVLLEKLYIFSFPIIFLFVTFLFTCSSPILYFLYDIKGFSEWRFIDLEATNISLTYVNLLFSSFYIGVTLSTKYRNNVDYVKQSSSSNNKVYQFHFLRIIGFFLLIFSFISILIPTIQGKGLFTFVNASYSEYHAERNEGNVDIFFKLAFSNFIPWGLLLICLGTKNIKQFSRYIIFFALPFILIIFLTGDRSSAFPIILLLLSIFYIKFHNTVKIPWKKIMIISIVALYLIPVLRVTRKIPISQWNFTTIVNIFTFQENNFKIDKDQNLNVFTSTLYSASEQLQTLVGTVKLVPAKDSYRYGFDYFIRPVIVAIPFYNFFVDLDFTRGASIWAQPTQWITYHYNTKGTGLAYLQVAEAYLNFGSLGIVIFYVLAGFALTRFWYKSFSLLYINPKRLAFSMLFLTNVINWIRNDATGQLRYLTWAWIIIYGGFFILRNLTKRHRYNKSKYAS